uniref:Reverse transcriptase domain-containing protein n=1 Tax=Trichogramma kaykai TaxID=54128 RepID=A0ABD2WA87_9HYME
MEDFRCTTVTYGTAAASFLALRVMKQLAEDGSNGYPEASHALRHQLYVDDIFFGADTVGETVCRRNQLIELLATAGKKLAKWSANHRSLVEGLVSSSQESVALKIDEAVSTLGLRWLPGPDNFTFQFRPQPASSTVTRRSILSDISLTFDPMGWLAPALVVAKVLLQDVCLDGSDWDSPVSATLGQRWSEFCSTLPDVSRVRDLAAFSLWWTGPAWLVKEEDQWPKMDVAESIVQTMVATKARPDSRPAVEGECMSEFDICPNFRMVLKVLALIYHWHSRASHRVRGTAVISEADALRKARIGCFRSIQRFHFADEVTELREERILSKRSHLS